jgi:membrane protease YdiL (CAAX protease family)
MAFAERPLVCSTFSFGSNMKPAFVLPLFFLVLFLGAIVLGPVFFWGLSWISPIPFHRAMDRALLISALAALVLFRARIPFAQLWPCHHDAWKQVLLGLFIAAVSAQAMIGFKLAVDGITPASLDRHAMMASVFVALVAALLVAPLEETLFRGFLQSELIERLGLRSGWIVAAAIFMLAHFLKVPDELDSLPVHPWSGVTALGSAFLPLAHGDFLSGRGLNLLLLGLILGGTFLRSGSLWVNAGLHGGLIFAQLLFSRFTRPAPLHSVFLGGDIVSSPITSLVFILLGLWLWLFYRHPSILPENGENAP